MAVSASSTVKVTLPADKLACLGWVVLVDSNFHFLGLSDRTVVGYRAIGYRRAPRVFCVIKARIGMRANAVG